MNIDPLDDSILGSDQKPPKGNGWLLVVLVLLAVVAAILARAVGQ